MKNLKPTNKEIKEFEALGYWYLHKKAKVSWPLYGHDKEDMVQYLLLSICSSYARGKPWDSSKAKKSAFVSVILSRRISKMIEKQKNRLIELSLEKNTALALATPEDNLIVDYLAAESYSGFLTTLEETEREVWDTVMFSSRALGSYIGRQYESGEKKNLLVKVEKWANDRNE